MSDDSVYPVGLRLRGRRVLVLGGGAVARRRLPALTAAGADVLVVAPWVTPAVRAVVDSGAVRWEQRGYRPGDLAGAWYALLATDDPAVNAAAAAEAEERRVWCVRSDDARAASAWTPATGRGDGVTVAVLSGDPRRSAAVRDHVVSGLRDGTVAAPRHRRRAAGVAIVGGGPGDPDLITVRGRRLLAEADVVIADHLGPHALLDELPDRTEVVDAAKIPYGPSTPQRAINAAMLEHARAGRFVVRLKGGDPFVFGRGKEEAQVLAAAGVPVTVVPGVTSAVSVPGAAGVPVTHRGTAHEFTVVSGHLHPDDERSLVDWPALGRLRGTLVLLMAVERAGAIARTLIAHGRAADTPATAVQDGTTAGQRRVDATLDTLASRIAEAGLRPPAVIVVGDVAALGDGAPGGPADGAVPGTGSVPSDGANGTSPRNEPHR